jgi:hypothetical protein
MDHFGSGFVPAIRSFSTIFCYFMWIFHLAVEKIYCTPFQVVRTQFWLLTVGFGSGPLWSWILEYTMKEISFPHTVQSGPEACFYRPPSPTTTLFTTWSLEGYHVRTSLRLRQCCSVWDLLKRTSTCFTVCLLAPSNISSLCGGLRIVSFAITIVL